jgi:adenylylsulfate kinase
MNHKGFTLWFTGLPCSGKTTVSNGVAKRLKVMGCKYTEILDGDLVRQSLTKDLGFSKEDRDRNIESVTFIAKLLSRNGVATLVAFVSPYREKRQKARQETTNFIEVYVKCPLYECIKRDIKGMYKKAMAGKIRYFTGINDPYEEPENPEIILDTEKESIEESVTKVIDKLKDLNLISEH